MDFKKVSFEQKIKKLSVSAIFGNYGATVAAGFFDVKNGRKIVQKNVDTWSLTEDYHSNSKN